jgi:hypothetical protein
MVALLIGLFAFTPISHALLASADGSFSPAPFTSLALRSPSNPAGYEVGDLIPVRLTNHTGSTKTYHWDATQKGVVVSLGEETLPNGRTTTIDVPTNFGRAGTLRIAVARSDVYLTIHLASAAQ